MTSVTRRCDYCDTASWELPGSWWGEASVLLASPLGLCTGSTPYSLLWDRMARNSDLLGCALHRTSILYFGSQGTQFSVIVTEGRPDATGVRMAKALDEMGIPSTLILDSGVAYSMERCAGGRGLFREEGHAREAHSRGGPVWGRRRPVSVGGTSTRCWATAPHTTWRDVPRADEQGEVCFALDLLSRLITATLIVRQG